MEKKKFRYGKFNYDYILERSERKTFSLVVMPNLNIILKVPASASDNDIEHFLIKKWLWLKKQIRELERYKKPKFKKEYISGESFYYLGRQYMLSVEKGEDGIVKVLPGRIVLNTKMSLANSEHNKSIYEKWYIDRCNIVFKKELLLAVKKYGVGFVPRLKIREMKGRWGSYQQNGIINLNPKLLQTSKTMIGYVIAHELCHIEYKDHNTKFYELLESRVPGWETIKDELEVRFG